MRKRKKIIVLALIFFYILMAPEKENSVLKILPAWASSLQAEADIDETTLIPFRLGKNFGYISRGGNISFISEIFHNVTQSNNYFINYSAITDNLVIRRNNGNFVTNLTTSGFPIFINERLFVISANSKKISEWNIDGENLFSFEHVSQLTSLDAGKDTIVAGFVDGTVVIADKTGNTEKLIIPKSSRINITYGVAISDNSNFVAMITGLDPQYMIIMRKRRGQYEKFFSYQFEENLRHARFISFFNNDRYLAFTSDRIFFCFDFSSRQLHRIDLAATITNVHYIDSLNLFAVTTRKENGKTDFILIDPTCSKLYSKTIVADFNYIGSSGNKVFFGAEQTIFAAEFVREGI
ncbi:MAG: hypothetical protein FWC36_10195 [Spirochaetes bacterium]|nr:hypothetical protein [Spirochaetota bacterium]